MAAPALLNRRQTRSLRMHRSSVRKPSLGLYLDRAPLDIDPRALEDCLNVRIENGRIEANGLGWENFPQFASDVDRINLDSIPVRYIDEYRSRSGATTSLFCNRRDIFRFDPGTGTVLYMNPRYVTGTAAAPGGGTQVNGTGTAWNTAKTTTPVAGGYGNNVRPGDFIHFGTANENDPSVTWYEIASVGDDTTLQLLVDPGAQVDGPYTIRQALTGDNNDIFASDTFAQSLDHPSENDVYYLTNGIEMLSWDGDDATFTWFWPGFAAKNVRAYQQTLAMWNILEGGDRKNSTIKYSELNHPENFTSNGAGEIVPADGVLDLLAIVPIGDQLVCYFQGDIVLLQYVGPPLYFVARVAVPGVGLAAQRAIIDFGDYHEFLSNDAAYRFDGVQIVESMHQVFREVLRSSNPNLIGQAYAHIDEERGDVIWSVPLTTDGGDADQPPVYGYAQHYLEDVGETLPQPITKRDFPFTAAGHYTSATQLKFDDFPAEAFEDSALRWNDRTLGQLFPVQIVGNYSGDIYIRNTSNKRGSSSLFQLARFPRMALGDGELKGLVHWIAPFTRRRQGSSGYELTVKIDFYDFADGDVIDFEIVGFDMTHQGTRFVPVRKGGRYGSILFYTSGLDIGAVKSQPWDLAGYEIKVSPMGDR